MRFERGLEDVLALAAIRKVAACPLVRTLAISANCWAETEDRAREVAHQAWPLAGIPGPIRSELRRPKEFEALTDLVTPEQVAEKMPLGPDPARHAAAIEEFAKAGFTHVWVHQVGPDQNGFLDFWEKELRPAIEGQQAAVRS